MFDDSDFTLRWPADLLADELEANAATQDHGNTSLGKLLDEAFEGNGILDRVRAGDFENHRPETIGLDVNAWRIKSFRDRLIKTARSGQLASATEE